jgi:diketogulonate reductase-like aldo/keto reductase
MSEASKDPNVNLKVHVMIQWPRCYDAIEWMECEREENELPSEVKAAGPSPLLNKADAWKESWRALEDMYNSGDYPELAGLGVSNFGAHELRELIRVARVDPHIVQMSAWSLLLDPQLVGLCHYHDIQIQVFNVMHAILGNAESTPHAYHHLLLVANQLERQSSSSVTGAQVILKWLVQQEVSVVPRTSSLERLEENSVVSISSIPKLSEEQSKTVANAMEAMLTGTDMEEDVHVKVTFHAKNQDMFLYFFPGMDESTEKQITYIGKGSSFEEFTHPQHSFRIYNAYDPDVFRNYTVEGHYGDHHHVDVEM